MNIILGGTHGLGWEIALGLQARGEETFVSGRSWNGAEHGQGAAIDLKDATQAERFAAYIQDLGDTALTGFFWVAGYGYTGDFADQDSPRDMANANFANVLPIAQSAWKKMLAQQEPSNFVIVSSTSGYKARNNEAVYAATKHAQVGFARSLGLESERLKSPVQAALFMPGGMQTEFWDAQPNDAYDEFLDPKKVAALILERITQQGAAFYEEEIPRGSL